MALWPLRRPAPAPLCRTLAGDAPTVASVSPRQGPYGGGVALAVEGANFRSGATVTVGGAACSQLVVASSWRLECATTALPACGPPAVDVTVTNADEAAATLRDCYMPQGLRARQGTGAASESASG